MSRIRGVIRTSIIGITGNIFLSAFKIGVGLVSNSISVIMDGVNNFTDALASVITLVGAKLSVREPDRKHPFGYGRIEYLSALLIGIFILYAGVGAVRESFLRILHPEETVYTTEAVIILFAALVVKVSLGLYTKRKGIELGSTALAASGQDSLDDSIASAATLVAALVYLFGGPRIEAYVGLLISFLIIKTGIETLKETVGTLLGERVDVELAQSVKKTILSFPEVEGVFDLVIHNYGKEKLIGSACIEVPDALTSGWIDNLQRAVTAKVLEENGVELLGLSIYAVNSKDSDAVAVRDAITKITDENDSVKAMHAFYLDKVDKSIKFDIVVDYGVKDSAAVKKAVMDKVKALYPDYDVNITVKKDFAD